MTSQIESKLADTSSEILFFFNQFLYCFPGLGKMVPGRPFNLIHVWILYHLGGFFVFPWVLWVSFFFAWPLKFSTDSLGFL